MNIRRHSKEIVRRKLREEAEKLCVVLAPQAVQIMIVSPLDKVFVFVTCSNQSYSK